MAVAEEQDRERGDEHDDVDDDGEETAVLDAAEGAVGIGVPEEDEVAEVQRDRQQVEDRDDPGAVAVAAVEDDAGDDRGDKCEAEERDAPDNAAGS